MLPFVQGWGKARGSRTSEFTVTTNENGLAGFELLYFDTVRARVDALPTGFRANTTEYMFDGSKFTVEYGGEEILAGEDGRISLTFTDTAPYQSATFKITALEDATEDIDIDIKGSFDDPISTVAYKGGSRTETLTFLGAGQEIYVSAYVFCDKESNPLTNKKRNFVTKFRFLLIFWLKPLDFTGFLMSQPLFALVKRFCLIFWCFYDIVKIEKFKKFCNFCNLCIIFLVY